jgi:hypothetical protein
VKSNISEQTNYLQSKFTIIHPQNYKMSPLRDARRIGKKVPQKWRRETQLALKLLFEVFCDMDQWSDH